MTTNVAKIDSNGTGLHFCEEASLGVLPSAASQVWYPLEPNTYTDFGGQIKTATRNPILASRQRKKGVTVDLDAAGGITQDLTQTNLARLLQGFLFASYRENYDSRSFGHAAVADISVDGTDNGFESAAFGISTNVIANHLLYSSGWVNGANNGLKIVSAVTADTDVDVTDTGMVDEVYNANARIEIVGYHFASATVNIVNPGTNYPSLHRASGSVDWTTIGFKPGQWVFVGGDAANTSFAVQGYFWGRVLTVTATDITFDRTTATLVAETGTGKTIEVYFGKFLKNESDPTLQIRRSYTMQRKMGAPDTTQPTQIQSEYMKGSVAKTLKFTMATAALITTELSFMSLDNYSRTGVQGPLSTQGGGVTEVAADNTDAFNTTSHVAFAQMAVNSPTNANPAALFAYLTDMAITVENNLSPAKAIKVLGAFDITAGQFGVSGTATAYFADLTSVDAVRNNSDVGLQFGLVRQTPALVNAGMVVDMPLNSLGDARAKVELNKPIMLPLNVDSAPHRTLDYTLGLSTYNYLPAAA